MAASLTPEQQSALFLSLRELRLFAHGLRATAGRDPHTGAVTHSSIPAEVARWAIPYVERIRELEDLVRSGRQAEAIAGLSRLLDELPDAALVQMDLGVCLADQGEVASAQAWLVKAHMLAPAEHRPLIEENVRRIQSRYSADR